MKSLITCFLLIFAWPFLSSAKTLYILGVDGLSHEAFVRAQREGYFKDIKSVSHHIASFPTMTDLVWSDVLHTDKVYGQAGEIKSVEAVYFDESTKAIEGDVRDYYRRLAQPKYYMSGFQSVFNAYIEALMYFPTQELPKKEIQTVIDAMLASQNTDLVTGYIGAIDSIAHTQANRLYPVLQVLDAEISRFVKEKKASGQDFELILVSDHGNVGNFKEGEAEQGLIPIEIGPVLESIGMKSVQKLQNDHDIAMPLLALGTWAPVYLKNSNHADRLMTALIQQPWFDLGIQLVENSAQRIVIKVRGEKGAAYVHFSEATNSYIYEVIQGNPLEIPEEFHSTAGKRNALSAPVIEKITRAGPYPDSIIRLVEAVKSKQFAFPDLILTFKDGHYLNNSLGGVATMYRTHGSLTKAASMGIVASTGRNLTPYLRSRQILPYLSVNPVSMFGKTAQDWAKNPVQVISEAKEDKKGIATGARDYTDQRIFRMISKAVSFSRPYFIIDEIKDVLKVFGFNLDKSSQAGLSIEGFDPSKINTQNLIDPAQIGELTDIVIRNPDINELQKDPKVLKILDKVGIKNTGNSVELPRDKTLSAKRIAMKVYQVPYLLDQALTFQEKVYLPETRDLEFASYWQKNKEKINSNHSFLTSQHDSNWAFWKKASPESTAQRLFKEVLRESEIEEKIAPQDLNSIYKNSPEKLTIVYVPGTYNGIFDREIFSLGLLAIKEDLGVRVLTAPIKSACSSEINGEMVLNFLKDDQKKFIEKKQTPPQYVLLGYSKGTLDSLYAFIQDKEFVRENIKALVAIATPLKGSPILDKAELPFFIVNMLVQEDTPEICKKEKIATVSGTIQNMTRFWKRNEKDLIGLTRYFSVSFVSDPEDSHIIMKATKLIAQFDEDNDGIVNLSSSRFPNRLQAVDLGIVRGDHLAGILSSRFNQRAFLKGLVRTLAELGVENQNLSEQWRLGAIYSAASEALKSNYSVQLDPRTRKVQLTNLRGNIVAPDRKELTYRDPYDLNAQLFELQKNPLDLYESKAYLPANELSFEIDQVLDLAKMPDIVSTKKVTPSTIQNLKAGIDLSFDHADVLHYRLDHQWSYESRSPVGGDNNPQWGFQSVQGTDKTAWLALRSDNNSIRLTTLGYRFKPVDFPITELKLKVTKGPVGADPVKGRSGKDDSAFQAWFTLRDLRGTTDRSLGSKDAKVYTFGYYWGEEIPDEKRVAGQVFENYYSNKSVVVATLPPAFAIVLNTGKEDLGKEVDYRRNLADDIKRAYPDLDINQLEVIGITLQMDSNDTKSTSEAFMKTLRFLPSQNSTLDGRLSLNQK